MLGLMKLKIIINKMSNFINNLVDLVIKKYSRLGNHYKYNYFDYYSNNIGKLDEETLNVLYSVIESSHAEIDNVLINETSYFLSTDVSNEVVVASSNSIRNYILFCIYVSLLDIKVRRMYFNKKTIINIKEKIRPDVYLCENLDYKNEFIHFSYGKAILQLPLVKKFEHTIRQLKELKPPMPYYEIIDNMIFYEKPVHLNPERDPLIDVLKDIVNQLKTLNKYFLFQYMDKNSLGRSETGFKRYFVFFLDSLIGVGEKITSHNTYDGRRKYDKITGKDQIRTVIHILSEIYVTGTNSYLKNSQLEPFNEYLRILDELENDKVHENFLLYLMHVKKENF